MKTNNFTKIIIIIVIVLSVSITIRAAKSVFINKNIDSINNNEQPIVIPIDEAINDETINEVSEELITKSPVVTPDPIVAETPPLVEKPIIVEDLPTIEPVPKSEPSTNIPKIKENNHDDSKDDDSNVDKSNNSKNNKDKDKKENDNNHNHNQSIVVSKTISKDDAIEIGLNKIGSNSKLIDIESYLDDNPPKYVLRILNNKLKYKIEIHARTGSILDYKKE